MINILSATEISCVHNTCLFKVEGVVEIEGVESNKLRKVRYNTHL